MARAVPGSGGFAPEELWPEAICRLADQADSSERYTVQNSKAMTPKIPAHRHCHRD